MSRKKGQLVRINSLAFPMRKNPQLRAVFSFLEKQESSHTKEAYGKDLQEFFMRFPVTDFLDITQEHIVLFKNELKGKFSNATVVRKISTLRSFFQWLEQTEIIPKDPTQHIKAGRLDRFGKTPQLTDNQVKKLLAAPDCDLLHEHRDLVMLHLLFYTGLRSSELRFLRFKDFSMEESHHIVTVTGKRNRERKIPVRPFIVEEMKQYLQRLGTQLKPADYLFCPIRNNRTKNTDQPLTRPYVRQMVRKYARRAGIDTSLTTHSARVTVVGNCFEHGVSDVAIATLMGWSSSSMPAYYNRRKDQIKNSAVHQITY